MPLCPGKNPETMTMGAKPTAFLVLLMILSAGCSDPKQSWIRDETQGLNEMADVMSKITDVASYEAAKPKLRSLYDAQRARREKVIDKMNQTEKEAWWEEQKSTPDYPKHQEAANRYLQERNRVMGIPDVGMRLGTEMILPSHQ